jgi:hypothetical protein
MPDFEEEMALLFKQSATGPAATAEKRAAMNDPARQNEAEVARPPSRPTAWPGRPPAGGRLRGGVAVSPGARPGGAAPVAGQDGWAALPGKFGRTKVASGHEPEVRFVSTERSPEPMATGHAGGTDQATTAAKKHAADRAWQDMMSQYQAQNQAESGEVVVDGRFQ